MQQRINACSFTTEYVLAVMLGAGDRLPADLRAALRERIGRDVLHYAKKDLQHHGYNDNHVTLATASLVLGGELVGNSEAVEEGRANLMNFRDTFLRRGFMHETNDCYIPHSLYSTAIVAEFAQDPEIRQLARDGEARIWADWIGHWHPNLGRKPGPSARDYTGGRLLSSGSSSRLFTEVRERRGLCYTVNASLHTQRDRAAVFCYAGTTAERAARNPRRHDRRAETARRRNRSERARPAQGTHQELAHHAAGIVVSP